MSNSSFRKSAIAAAVVSLGVSMGAFAQGSAGSSASGTTSSGTGMAAGQSGTSGGAAAADRSGATGAMGGDSGAMRDRSTSGSSGSMSRDESTRGGMTSRDSSTSGATAQNRSGQQASGGNLSRSDKKFVEEAALGSMAEVRLGQLAQQKASSDEVKQFGSRMVQDHTKAIEQLSTLAKDDGVQLPSKLDSKHQRTYDKLSKLSGDEFDREYMKEMNADHKKDISQFQKAAKSADDPQIQQFAQQTLPTLQEHKKMGETTLDDLRKGATVSMRSQGASDSGSQTQSQSSRR